MRPCKKQLRITRKNQNKTENKTVGWIIIGISVIIGVIVLIFNLGLKKIIGDTCSHGPTCSMFDTVAVQTWISLAIALVILAIGIVIMFMKPKEKIIVKKVKEKKKKLDLKGLNASKYFWLCIALAGVIIGFLLPTNKQTT